MLFIESPLMDSYILTKGTPENFKIKPIMLNGKAFVYIKAKICQLLGWDNQRKRRYESVESDESGSFTMKPDDDEPLEKVARTKYDSVSYSLGKDKNVMPNSAAASVLQQQHVETSDADDTSPHEVGAVSGVSAAVSSMSTLDICGDKKELSHLGLHSSVQQKSVDLEIKPGQPRRILKEVLFLCEMETYKNMLKKHTLSEEKKPLTQICSAANEVMSVDTSSSQRCLKSNLHVHSTREHKPYTPGTKDVQPVITKKESYGKMVLNLDHLQPKCTDDIVQEYKDMCFEINKKVKDSTNRARDFDVTKNKVFEDIMAKRYNEMLRRKKIVSPPIQESVVTYPTLTEEMEVVLNKSLDSALYSNESIRINNLTISKSSLDTLKGLKWLNDEIINFYMELLNERGQKQEYPTVYSFSTFFYSKIKNTGHAAVRRWTKKIDIFQHEFIVIPCHFTVHWSIAIVDFHNRTVSYYDSIGTTNSNVPNVILKYLADEYKDKKGENFDYEGWSCINAQDIPLQKNGSDCGVFALMIAEHVTRKAKLTFSQKDMPYFRRKIAYEIITKKILT